MAKSKILIIFERSPQATSKLTNIILYNYFLKKYEQMY